MIDTKKLSGFRERSITSGDIGQITGLSITDEIDISSLKYSRLYSDCRDYIITEILRTIEFGNLTKAGEKDRWDAGWQENLDLYLETRDERDLIPKYLLRDYQPVRIYNDYAISSNPLIELTFYSLYIDLVYHYYLNTSLVDTVYEFGCGSGHNLVSLAQLYPHLRIVGLDWSQPAVDIANELTRSYPNVSGRRFDFFHPDDDLEITPSTAILTIGALEQTDGKYPTFIDWLVSRDPLLCIHIEPQPDWYNDETLLGYLGLRFLQVRHYWSGFPQYMDRKNEDNELDILERKKVPFGSLFVEGYNRFVWRGTGHRGKPFRKDYNGTI